MATKPQPAGSLIREARARANLSQTDLARRANVAQSVVSAYESGRREPSFSTLSRLITATGHRLEIELKAGEGIRPGIPDTPLGRRIRQRRKRLLAVVEKNGASNVRVFGSVAHGEDTPESDVDILIDLSPSSGLVTLARLEREISHILGVPVDVVPADSLRPQVRMEVETEAIPL